MKNRSAVPEESIQITGPNAEPQSKIQIQNSKSLPRRRTSKIARLPKKLRDLINDRLSDGAPYDQIVLELNQSTDPPLPCEISCRNISDWYAGGYQDWLRHQDRLDILASRFDFALDLAQNSQPDKLQELSLQLAAIRMCEFLSELAIADPQTDPAIYLRLLSAVPRVSKEALNLQKYRDASAKAQAAHSGNLATEQDRAEAARTALLNQLDDIMGLRSYRHTPTPDAPPPPVEKRPPPPGASEPINPSIHESMNPLLAPAFAAEPINPSIQESINPSAPAAPAAETHGNPLKPNPPSAPINPLIQKSINPFSAPLAETHGNLQKPIPAGQAASRTATSEPSIPDEFPTSCALCGNRPYSFTAGPLPFDCQICPMRPPPPSAPEAPESRPGTLARTSDPM